MLEWLWLVPALLCVWGAFHLKGQRWVVVLLGWAFLHLLAMAVLQTGVYVWTFAPLAAASWGVPPSIGPY